MRILLLAREYTDPAQLSNFSAVYSYFLARALREAGADIVFANPGNKPAAYVALDLEGIDHILAVRNQHFIKAGLGCVRALRERFRGTITQINDSRIYCPIVDCTFTARDPLVMPGNHHVGWAADPEMCAPAQKTGELMILIDHPDYAAHRLEKDRSADIRRQVQALIDTPDLWRSRFERVAVCEIRDGEIAEADLTSLPGEFTRQHVPYPDACAAYGRAVLFMVTHRESLGLGVLETAMCGALPVVPAGFVAPDRLRTIRHVGYDRDVPWSKIFRSIDIDASRSEAMQNTWEAVATRMLQWFERAVARAAA